MQQQKSTIIQFGRGETVGKLLSDFYILVAEKIGFADDNTVMYDCRKINIAPNLQEILYAAYRSKHWDIYHRDPEDFDFQVTMLMANSGPKVDHKLKSNQAEVFDGYIGKREDFEQ